MKKQQIVLFAVILIVVIIRIYYRYNKKESYLNGDKIRITTSVKTEPVRYQNYQYFKLEGFKVNLPLYPKVNYGDKVVIEGIVDGNKLDQAELIDLIETNTFIYKFRQSLLIFYKNNLPEPHSSLIAGVTIGSKSNIPNHFWENLKYTGTAHVVVASGMNISLIAGFILNFFVLLMKRKKALIFTLIGIWLYALISGFDAPIVRSAIMGSIAFTAQEFGRISVSLRALFYSVIIMLLINPVYIEDVGFLLSFFATLGLILFETKIEYLLTDKLNVLKGSGTIVSSLRVDLATTISAQIAVFPILFYFFGTFNYISPLINTMVLWTIVPITILGLISGVLGLIVPILGKVILLITYPLTLWFVFVINTFSQVKNIPIF